MHELQVSTHCDSLQVFTDWSKKVNEQFMSQQRNCLMLLDNASSHGVADTLITKVGSLDAFRLSNLLLLFLPPNCTSVVQPLDQGIIAAFKAHYKRKLARYMVQQYDIDSSQDLQVLSLKTNLKQVCIFFFTNDTEFLFMSYVWSYMHVNAISFTLDTFRLLCGL